MQMVRKSIADQKDWDYFSPAEKYLPHQLDTLHSSFCTARKFTAHLMPYANSGYPPQRHLDATEWLVQLRDSLDAMRATAAGKKSKAKTYSKTYHDKTAKDRQFKIGDKVLVFSPVVTGKRNDKLTDRWQGPYTIFGQVTHVTYVVNMQERNKNYRTVHSDAMKIWIEPVQQISTVNTLHDSDESSSAFPDYHPHSSSVPIHFGSDRSPQFREQIQRILAEFSKVASDSIRRTSMAVHHIVTNKAILVRLRSYRCPAVYEKAFREELDLLLELGFIEESSSPWASPASFSCIEGEWLYLLVVDYRRLNLVTAPDPYCMPRIELVLERMSRAYIFSTVYLAKGFYQVPVHSPHILRLHSSLNMESLTSLSCSFDFPKTHGCSSKERSSLFMLLHR